MPDAEETNKIHVRLHAVHAMDAKIHLAGNNTERYETSRVSRSCR